MQISLPYAKTQLTATIADSFQIDLIQPNSTPPADNPIEVVKQALNNPIQSPKLKDFTNTQTVAIAINDKTRPVPHDQLLPPLLDELDQLSIPPENITFFIATGAHPVMLPDEYSQILPDWIIERYPILCHDALDNENLTYLGTTSRNTPVYINSAYLSADLRITIGNIEPHQFQGFSGGVKSVSIGLAGKQTINHNHALMTHTNSQLGHFHNNPARQDVEDIGKLIRVDFAFNALLNGNKQIVDVIAGNPSAIMTVAIPKVRQIFQVPIGQPYDLLIVSPGGHPKDINIYQTQKGLAHAALITKPNGTIILTAACPEGTGSLSYEQWITNESMNTHQDVFERFQQEGFQVGPHKAYQISRDASRIQVHLVSDMPADFVKRLLLYPADNLQSAIDNALTQVPDNARIGIMPYANATIPNLEINT